MNMELTKLNEQRKSKKIQIATIVEATGISRSTVSSILAGNKRAKYVHVVAIADYLGFMLQLVAI